MSTRGRAFFLAALAGCFVVVLEASAAAQTGKDLPGHMKPSPVRVVAADDFTHTFDRLGPQATARAVRASLKVALMPDPLCMGSLLFCAFSLRWMRMRKERTQPASTPPATVLPGAA